MKKDLSKIFIDKIYDPPHKKVYLTNKIIVKSIDDTWSLSLLDLVDYIVKTIEVIAIFRFVLTIQ